MGVLIEKIIKNSKYTIKNRGVYLKNKKGPDFHLILFYLNGLDMSTD